MTDAFKKISDSFSAAGQPSPEELQQAAAEGFRSVLNLRSPDEAAIVSEEADKAAAAGLDYANVPLSNANPSLEQVQQALVELEGLPRPVLIHCAAGARAGAIALIAEAVEAGLTPEEIVARAAAAGVSLDQPHLQQFLKQASDSAEPT